MLRYFSIYVAFLSVDFGGPTRATKFRRLGNFGDLIFIDFLGLEAWEAWTAKVPFNRSRVLFCRFR